MHRFLLRLLTIFCAAAANGMAQQGTVNIATVNSPAMMQLRTLSIAFEAENPGIKLNWVIVEENLLHQRVATDVAAGSGEFDVVFIGMYETSTYAKRGWLKPMGDLPTDYDIEDVFKSLRDGLSYQGKLYALPFQGESSFLMYRKDLFQEKGLEMPAQPTYEGIAKFADALTDPSRSIYGITLRGKPGWGENMFYVSTLINTFGGTWFDMQWRPTINTPEWKRAITFYRNLMQRAGPPGASSNGFNENLTLFSSGRAAMWIDSTEAGRFLEGNRESEVAGKIGYVPAPIDVTPNGSHWLWSWGFAIPKTAKNAEAAQKFAEWATSKEYIRLAAKSGDWSSIPEGTRKSTYETPQYREKPYTAAVLNALQSADPTNPCIKPVPYTGIQLVDIPEFPEVGNVVGQHIAGTLAGKSDVAQALMDSQAFVQRVVKRGERPTPSPTPPSTPPPVADKQCVSVLYATNRVRKTGASVQGKVEDFSSERTQHLSFGEAVVRVPDEHKVGKIEKEHEIWLEGMLVSVAENSKTDFILRAASPLSKDEFLKSIDDRNTPSALLFVHGFNTSFRDALFELAQIKWDTNYPGVAIAFSWPSKGPINPAVQPFEAMVAYNYDRESAQYSQDAFLEVLRLLHTSANVSKVYIIAHSMGNQLVLNAVNQASCGDEKLAIAQMVLAAPDVDWDLFKLSAYRLVAAATGITLYASSVDKALGFSVKWNGDNRAGFIQKSLGPLTYPGIKTIDVSALGDDMFDFNHDTYRTQRTVLDDIGQIMIDGNHLAGLRAHPLGSEKPDYWIFPP
jgi:sorbitol/mannitol transport system substrate-binding protein